MENDIRALDALFAQEPLWNAKAIVHVPKMRVIVSLPLITFVEQTT